MNQRYLKLGNSPQYGSVVDVFGVVRCVGVHTLGSSYIAPSCKRLPYLLQVLEEDQTCEGAAQKDMGECRMDMVESEMGYLGYDATESYGITWKVTDKQRHHTRDGSGTQKQKTVKEAGLG